MEHNSRMRRPGTAHEYMRGAVVDEHYPRTEMKIFSFKNGLQAGFEHHWLEKDASYQVTTMDEHLYLSFLLEGDMVGSCDGLSRGETFPSGVGRCWYTPGRQGMVRIPKGTKLHRMTVGLDRKFIDDRLGGPGDPGFTNGLCTALEQRGAGYCHKPFIITPWMRSVVHRLEHNPYQGRLGELYAEARVLDLLVLCMEAISGRDTAEDGIRLSSQDVEQVRQAGDILVRCMEDPPSVIALSRQVGLNETKLKQGFQTIFNCTPFGWLRRQRMIRARDLLSGGDVTVCQAANAVGYVNASHFSKAFVETFGVLPGAFLGEARDRATMARKFTAGP